MSTPMVAPTGGYAPATGRVDFGWLKQAWALLNARAGLWAGTTALFFLFSLALWLLWLVPTGGLNTLRQTWIAVISANPGSMPKSNPIQDFALNRAFAVLAGGVSGVFLGGLYRTALRQMRGEPVSALGLFSGFPQAGSLLAVGVVVPAFTGLLEGLIFWLLHLAHVSAALSATPLGLLNWLLSLVFGALTMFAPLRVVDQGEGATDAILGSARLLHGQRLRGVLFYFVATLVSGLGGLACGIGMLATYPVLLLGIAVGYWSLTQPPLPAALPSPTPAPGVWPPPPRA
jgi:hypothetical protein